VQALLLEGLTNEEIGRRLGVAEWCVNRDVGNLYKKHGVRGQNEKRRGALAEKLGVGLPPTRFDLMREKIAGMRERGMTFREIGEELGMNINTVGHYVAKTRRRASPQSSTSVSEIPVTA
jgi:DNA-binding CsgD family transcriptional regulator